MDGIFQDGKGEHRIHLDKICSLTLGCRGADKCLLEMLAKRRECLIAIVFVSGEVECCMMFKDLPLMSQLRYQREVFIGNGRKGSGEGLHVLVKRN
jgi:hypothetical protein